MRSVTVRKPLALKVIKPADAQQGKAADGTGITHAALPELPLTRSDIRMSSYLPSQAINERSSTTDGPSEPTDDQSEDHADPSAHAEYITKLCRNLAYYAMSLNVVIGASTST